MEAGRIIVDARQIADADLGAGGPGHTLAVRTALGLDDDHAVRGRGPVERGARGTLHDFDRLNVERADLVQVADAHDRAVDDDQRAGRAAGAVNRRRAAEHDLGVVTRLSARLRHPQARHLAGQGAQRIERRDRKVFRSYAGDRERHLRALRAFERARDGHFTQAIDVALEGEVVGLRADPERQLCHARRVTDRAGPEIDGLAGRARRRDADGVDTGFVRRHREREFGDEDVRQGERLSALTGHLPRDHGRLGLGLRHGRCEEKARHGAGDRSERVEHGPSRHTSPLVRKGGGTALSTFGIVCPS